MLYDQRNWKCCYINIEYIKICPYISDICVTSHEKACRQPVSQLSIVSENKHTNKQTDSWGTVLVHITITVRSTRQSHRMNVSTTDRHFTKYFFCCFNFSVIFRYSCTWIFSDFFYKHLTCPFFKFFIFCIKWCWRRMEKICWTDHVRNEEVLLRVNEQRNILHEIIKRKANWIGNILRRNCLLKQVIEGKI